VGPVQLVGSTLSTASEWVWFLRSAVPGSYAVFAVASVYQATPGQWVLDRNPISGSGSYLTVQFTYGGAALANFQSFSGARYLFGPTKDAVIAQAYSATDW